MTNHCHVGWNTSIITKQDLIDVFMQNRGLFVYIGKGYGRGFPFDEIINDVYIHIFDDGAARWRKYDETRADNPLNFLCCYARQFFSLDCKKATRRAMHTQACCAQNERTSKYVPVNPFNVIGVSDTFNLVRRRMSDNDRRIFDAVCQAGGNKKIAASRLDMTVGNINRRLSACAEQLRVHRLIS